MHKFLGSIPSNKCVNHKAGGIRCRSQRHRTGGRVNHRSVKIILNLGVLQRDQQYLVMYTAWGMGWSSNFFISVSFLSEKEALRFWKDPHAPVHSLSQCSHFLSLETPPIPHPLQVLSFLLAAGRELATDT